ncbi:hypothetical protein [uncultured Christiangramia sp.]|uniref:hypothetical protein n=1 Tax=Christiangramia sp. 3-2217-3z TaxID=3417564 RepID=UPI0026350EC7|nr:hypothetical protein [uncultured Christiangramia sp.]
MKAEIAYKFLKASIEQMTDKERVRLSEMILPSESKPKKCKKVDPIPSNDYYRRKLLESGMFKSGPGLTNK